MAAAPPYKVYTADKRYVAATKDIEAAAVVAQFYGDGSTIRIEHSFVVWTQGEGHDGDACESYDATWTTASQRYEAEHGRGFPF